jgi:glycosyltransferase family protein
MTLKDFIKKIIRRTKELLKLLNRIEDLELRYEELSNNLYYEIGSIKEDIIILDMEDTLNNIIKNRSSVCRFGDGEFEVISGINMSFQQYDSEMQRRLQEILKKPIKNCICCMPKIYGDLSCYVPFYQRYWRKVASWSRNLILPQISSDYLFLGNAEISRPYMGLRDKTIAPRIFNLWKKLIANKRLLIVEGRFSRLGIGNDFLCGAKEIRRIWCPPINAFKFYKEILTEIEKNMEGIDIVLLALGGVATILAYDLSKMGYWAIDAGHVDVEYTWMQMGVLQKVPIPGKYVNECCRDGREMIEIKGEIALHNVIKVIGC